MITWPHDRGDWEPLLAEVEPVFVALAREIAAREPLLVNCLDESHRKRVRQRLQDAGIDTGAVMLALAPSNDSWARDHGPLTVMDGGRPLLLDFRFNGWGNKYPAALDDAITSRLAAQQIFGATPVRSIDFVLEGGAIDSDGRGTLLTTRRCLLGPNRNPGLDRRQIERQLQRYLGAERVLWLQHGALEGDDTDGHIDMLARFCDSSTIVYQACDETDYTAYVELRDMEAELQTFRTADGAPYRLISLPWPGPVHGRDGKRLPASYANFLPINGALLVPAYDDPRDAAAADTLASLFPDREVVPIPCRPLVEQYGSLHCATLQFPAGVELRQPVTG